MRILAFGDTHGNTQQLQKVMEKARHADLVLCLGDLTVFEHQLGSILDRLDSLNKKILLIHGNHEDQENMRKLCEERKNLLFIHDGFYKHQDCLFIGYGGGGFSKEDKHFERRSEHFSMIAKNTKLILMLHQPPYGTSPDVVGKEHTGSRSFRNFIEEAQPSMVFCAHIHETFGQQDTLGESIIINPGPEGMLFEI